MDVGLSGRGVAQASAAWLWRRRWQVALNAFLLSPLVFYELRLEEGGPDRSTAFLCALSVAWLALVQLLIKRPLFAHLALLPLYVTTALDLFLITNYRMRLASSTLLVIVENLGDSVDYLKAHGSKIALTVGAFVAFYVLSLWKIRKLDEPRRWRMTAAVFAALLGLYGIFAYRSGGWFSFMLYQDRNAPFGIFPQGYVALALRADLQRRSQSALNFSFRAKRQIAVDGPETYVLVIGESARPDHFGVYGYPRKTTPRLDRQANLIAFRSVVSQASVTKDSVPFILTRGHVKNPNRTADERSIVSVFGELGFETYWFSTQQRDLTTGLINRYTSEAGTQRFYDRRYDTFLLSDINRARASQPNGNQKRFLVVHTSGSHFYYPTRYPPEFAVFPTGSMSSVQDTINAYDNSVVYTDYLLSQIIDGLQQMPGLKALLYVSDHGENLHDDSRGLFGHMMNTQYDLPVPMLLWYSPELAARFPEKIANARENVNRRLSTRNVFYTLQDLAGASLVGDDPAALTLSVFAPACTEPARFVSADPEPFDFDAKFPGYQKQQAAAARGVLQGSPTETIQ